MQAEKKVYKFTGNINCPCDIGHMARIDKEYRNFLMLERLRPVDRANIKGMIRATLFNLKLYRLAGGY
mgnify:CR=1 FL=1